MKIIDNRKESKEYKRVCDMELGSLFHCNSVFFMKTVLGAVSLESGEYQKNEFFYEKYTILKGTITIRS